MIVGCYRCVVGKYDEISSLKTYDCNNHVLYTDVRKEFPEKWDIRNLCSPPRLKSGHDKNRFHKFFPYHLMPDADYSIYMDGNIEFSGDIIRLVKILVDTGASLGIFKHPDGRNMVEESNACLRLGKFDKYDTEVVTKQLEFYSSSGYDVTAPIGANYLIVRRHNDPDLKLAMSLWWSLIFEYTKRDQLSLMYCLWRCGVKWVFFDDYISKDDGEIIRSSHAKTSFFKKIKNKVRVVFSSYAVKNDGLN